MWATRRNDFEWEIPLSDNESRKRAAREFQAANPGTSYTRALRQVSKERTRRPLTAVLGTGFDGRPVEVNLEWESRGGNGPHCVVIGDEVSSLLTVLATGLAAGQAPGDLELVLCAGEDTQLQVTHRRVDADELTEILDELLQSRYEFFRSIGARDIEDARQHGHQVPTTVVLIEDRDGLWARSQGLARWLRVGRSVGINLVVGTPIAPPTVPTSVDATSPALALDRAVRTATLGNGLLPSMTTAEIFNRGEGHGTLRTSERGRAHHVLTDFNLPT